MVTRESSAASGAGDPRPDWQFESTSPDEADARPATCQLGGVTDPCPNAAELKVADGWGDAAWGCAVHVDEALVSARGVFLADEDHAVLREFRKRT